MTPSACDSRLLPEDGPHEVQAPGTSYSLHLSSSSGDLDHSELLWRELRPQWETSPFLALPGFNLDSDHGIEAGAQEGSLTQPSSHWILLDLL